MVSSVESCFNTELAPILDLVLHLPTNSQRPVANMSQGGERRVGSLKDKGENKGKVVGKIISTQIPTSLPTKPIVTTSTTTSTTPSINVDLSKLEINERLNIGEGGSGSTNDKNITTSEQISKGKGISVDLSKKEKKKIHELEMERLRQLSSIMSQRENDPLGLKKGDPNKVWCYETIETAILDNVDEFMK